MSSAILYLAIIVIWACVLIPRWLRRDSARAAATPDTAADDSSVTGPPADAASQDDANPADLASGPEADLPGTRVPLSREESRRRVLAARRRLLWMMLGLEAVGAALAGTGLGAWWVIVPPTVMLAGYLLLLRAAAQADAERDARELAAKEAARARAARASASERAGRHSAAASDTATATAPAVPAAFAAAPVPEDYDDSTPGRDFTPGRRRASAADGYEDHDAYDQYAENRLRAVGD